jgi:hypothetical protein
MEAVGACVAYCMLSHLRRQYYDSDVHPVCMRIDTFMWQWIVTDCSFHLYLLKAIHKTIWNNLSNYKGHVLSGWYKTVTVDLHNKASVVSESQEMCVENSCTPVEHILLLIFHFWWLNSLAHPCHQCSTFKMLIFTHLIVFGVFADIILIFLNHKWQI